MKNLAELAYSRLVEKADEIFSKERDPRIQTLLLYSVMLIRETIVAFGSCTSCYGKGYSTQRETAGTSRGVWELFPYLPCAYCDRGKQIAKLIEDVRADELKRPHGGGKG